MSNQQRPPNGYSASPPKHCMGCAQRRNVSGSKTTRQGWRCFWCLLPKSDPASQ